MISIEIVQENETQKNFLNELQSHVTDLECQLVEAEKLRKKLHNTILVCFLIIFYTFSNSNIALTLLCVSQELKGNIRVFCRVRPVLPDIDCRGTDVTVVSYPTSVEYLGRGIDLMNNGKRFLFFIC